eukprot:scaffold35373_cov62-Cyclotella_meneghiniana.AAC.3
MSDVTSHNLHCAGTASNYNILPLGNQVEYIARPFTCTSAQAEPDTRAIVGKIGGSRSPFWGAVRPPPYNQKAIQQQISLRRNRHEDSKIIKA